MSTSSAVAVSHEGAENAADVYVAVNEALGESLFERLKNHEDVSKTLTAHAADLDAVIAAARLPRCDFGLDWSLGWEMTLPNIYYVRNMVFVLKADADRQIAERHLDAAADRACAIIDIGLQLAGPSRTSLEIMSSAAFVRVGVQLINDHPELGSTTHASRMKQSFERVRSDGTLGALRVVQVELADRAAWLRAGKIPDLRMDGGRDWAHMETWDREKAARELDDVRKQIGAAWNEPDAMPRLKAILRRAEANGLVSLVGVPSKAKATMIDLEQALEKAQAAIR